MNEVRIGLVGFGGISRLHAGYLSAGEVPGARLTAICDPVPAAQEAARQAYPEARVFDSPEALFASGAADGVIVGTPHFSHPPLAIQAIESGHHVLIEKPAGVYTRHVREMNAVAEKSDRVFGIMFNLRAAAAHQKLRELVQNGDLGQIRRSHYVITDWYRSQAYYNSGGWRATWGGEGGGVLLNQAPHNLDLWQWICGMPKRVRAFCNFGKYHDIEVEDDVTAYVEYENGATGVFITSTGEAPGSRSLEITGDRGRIVVEGQKVTFQRTTESVQEHIRNSPGVWSSPEVWTCDVPASGGGDHKEITKNWVGAILNGTPLLSPGIEGINGVELANAMLLSTWTDSWVDLPIDDDLYYEKLREKVNASKRFDAKW